MGYTYLYSTDGPTAPQGQCYRIESHSDVSDEADLQDIGRDAADDFYRNHDGWESSWPVTFSFFTGDGRHLGDVAVDIEFAPTFHVCGVQVGGQA